MATYIASKCMVINKCMLVKAVHLDRLFAVRGLYQKRAECDWFLQDLLEAFEMDTSAFSSIATKAIAAFKASEAAKKARELVRRKSSLVKSTLPGKLADCSSSEVEESEIFIVEGDSAGAAPSPCFGCLGCLVVQFTFCFCCV